jgi:O-antigen/teichoic acid export membrane protein
LPIYILRHGLLLVFMVAAVALGFEASAVNAFICLILVLALSLVYQAVDILVRLGRVLEPATPAYRAGEWMRGSAPFAILYGGQHLAAFADVLVLSFFVSPAGIAIYFAATRIIQVVNLVPYAATVGSAHLFAASHARGDRDELQRLCRHVSVTTFVVATLAVGLILLSGAWLLAMFGPGFEAGYAPLAVLAIGVMARVTAGPAEDILNMTGHSSLSASTYLAVIVLSVVLAVALVLPFGVNGAATASAFALAVRAVWLLVLARRRLGINTSVFSALLSPASLPGTRQSGVLTKS